MDGILQNLLAQIESNDRKQFECALLDLRLIIERFTQNRYEDEETSNYLLLLNDKSLIDYPLSKEELEIIKYFLFFILFNFPDRAVLIAKCIKVLFDKSIREAVCFALEVYMEKDDHATCELMFAITNVGDLPDYFLNKRILDLFQKIAVIGGVNSKEVANAQLYYFKKYFKHFS